MKVKVHPHKTMVNAGVEACVSVTPVRKHAHAYYMGTVMLKDAFFVIHTSGLERAKDEQQRNVHAWSVGELVSEKPEQYPPDHPALRGRLKKVTYHYNIGRFMTVEKNPNDVVDVTDGRFKVAYFCGRDFYVSEF